MASATPAGFSRGHHPRPPTPALRAYPPPVCALSNGPRQPPAQFAFSPGPSPTNYPCSAPNPVLQQPPCAPYALCPPCPAPNYRPLSAHAQRQQCRWMTLPPGLGGDAAAPRPLPAPPPARHPQCTCPFPAPPCTCFRPLPPQQLNCSSAPLQCTCARAFAGGDILNPPRSAPPLQPKCSPSSLLQCTCNRNLPFMPPVQGVGLQAGLYPHPSQNAFTPLYPVNVNATGNVQTYQLNIPQNNAVPGNFQHNRVQCIPNHSMVENNARMTNYGSNMAQNMPPQVNQLQIMNAQKNIPERQSPNVLQNIHQNNQAQLTEQRYAANSSPYKGGTTCGLEDKTNMLNQIGYHPNVQGVSHYNTPHPIGSGIVPNATNSSGQVNPQKANECKEQSEPSAAPPNPQGVCQQQQQQPASQLVPHRPGQLANLHDVRAGLTRSYVRLAEAPAAASRVRHPQSVFTALPSPAAGLAKDQPRMVCEEEWVHPSLVAPACPVHTELGAVRSCPLHAPSTPCPVHGAPAPWRMPPCPVHGATIPPQFKWVAAAPCDRALSAPLPCTTPCPPALPVPSPLPCLPSCPPSCPLSRYTPQQALALMPPPSAPAASSRPQTAPFGSQGECDPRAVTAPAADAEQDLSEAPSRGAEMRAKWLQSCYSKPVRVLRGGKLQSDAGSRRWNGMQDSNDKDTNVD